MTTVEVKAASRDRDAWDAGPDEVVLGVDVIELVSSSMYVDPLAAYREYVQNAADAIDDARATGVLPAGRSGRVDIFIDTTARAVRIRDNGTGLGGEDFVRRLTAFGASEKRGRQKRGFRGVGRLAGIGFCQELIFRSRTSTDQPVHELRWDCRYLRASLRSADFCTLAESVHAATSHRTTHIQNYPDRFFEVELRGIVRHGKDDLLSASAVQTYLSQVAPVPFSPIFKYRHEIDHFLSDLPTPADLEIYVDGFGPIYRPHADAVKVKPGVEAFVDDLEFFTIPGVDGGIAAKGWVVHHSYLGAIPREASVRGLRLRTGNIQVGDDSTLEQIFQESRFNAWSVGEFHILDSRIIPNGRRDQYEQSVHLANVLNHIAPIARDIGHRCRTRSQYRQLMRKAELLIVEIEHGLSVLKQGAVSATSRSRLVSKLENSLQVLERVTTASMLTTVDRSTHSTKVTSLRKRLTRELDRDRSAARLNRMTPQKRRAYEEVFSLIYDCAADIRGAKELVDRVLARIKP